jgi:hypothetical protein
MCYLVDMQLCVLPSKCEIHSNSSFFIHVCVLVLTYGSLISLYLAGGKIVWVYMNKR